MSSSSGKPAAPITADRIREILNYDPDTGVFTWRTTMSSRATAGSVAGANNGKEYIRVGIDGRLYLAHRLAWLYVNGRWPHEQIDHINGNRADNRIANLREATNAENTQNRAICPKNTSGLAGVSWRRREKKWRAQIGVNGKTHHLGHFSDPAEAHAAYIAAKAQLHTFNPTVRGEE